jgi:enamine deaminase RidA (YjgF/YER057c/UK114 family)
VSHELINPNGMPPAAGFSHVVSAAPGRIIHVAGQIAADTSGAVVGATLAEQFDVALANVVTALAAAGAEPADVVSLAMYTTDMAEYRASTREIGKVYRARMGRHFPAMALVEITELVEPRARIEIVATAVVPSSPGTQEPV